MPRWGKLLDGMGVAHTVIDGRGAGMIGNVPIAAFDWRHEEIFEEMGQVQNTGYLIGGVSGEVENILLPGDAYCDPTALDSTLAGGGTLAPDSG